MQSNDLEQKDRQEFIRSRLGTEEWLEVARVGERRDKAAFWCALIPNDHAAQALKSTNWDLLIGHGHPGCVQYGGVDKKTSYFRFGDDDGIEPFVFYRSFHGLKPDYLELSEEFRLFHQLYPLPNSTKFMKFDDAGNEEDVAVVERYSVKVKLRLLKSYLAMKDMHLAVFFELDCDGTSALSEDEIQRISQKVREKNLCYDIWAGNSQFQMDGSAPAYSRILGKKLIAGYKREDSGMWPYETRKYTEFIVGVDKEGKLASFSCEPEKLANYFGANPGSPHFLTPVFFKLEVLNKYYAQPDKYSIEDGQLWCGGLWSLRLDNDHPKYVVVFLGDIGQSLTYEEQLYWKSFNVPPDGGISETCWRRGFLAEFANPKSPDLLFKSNFQSFQKSWESKFGWSLFLPLGEKDAHLFSSLHIPLTDEQAEFDGQVLALAKIFIDSLNEAALQKELGSKIENEKGIGKLERFLQSKGIQNPKVILYFKKLYTLRHGAGHRKGGDYEKAAKFFGVGERSLREVFAQILFIAVEILEFLGQNILKNTSKAEG
jgi:hypothetical protein